MGGEAGCEAAATASCLTADQQSLQVGRAESGAGQAQADTVEAGTGQQGGRQGGQTDITQVQVVELCSDR